MNRRLRLEILGLTTLLALPFQLRRSSRSRLPWLAAGLGLGTWALLPRRRYSFEGKSVAVTGGSRGLGFALAKELLAQGARVTLLARDGDELTSAEELLRAHFGLEKEADTGFDGTANALFSVVCDVTRTSDIDYAFSQVWNRFGALDVVINNAGAIIVGPLETMTDEDFAAQIKLHLRAPIQTLHAARHYFRLNGTANGQGRGSNGRVINVSSIGGKIPVPHMVPYCASKFALAGFSSAARAELRRDGIILTTAFPGLMRTGSTIQAVLKGDHEKEYLWFASGATAPGMSITAESAARQILRASAEGQAEVVVGWTAQLGSLVHACLPEIFAVATDLAARFQPQSNNPERSLGASSRRLFDQLTSLPFLQTVKRMEKRSREQHNQIAHSDPEFNLGV